MAKRYGHTCKSLVLRANKAELLARNAGSAYSVPDGEFSTLYDNIYRTINRDEVVIDSSKQSVEHTLAELRKIL